MGKKNGKMQHTMEVFVPEGKRIFGKLGRK
jgi:hypothetical protein